jgi:predicted  nucleic acid-binding Zn-ribbon protein
MLNDVRLKMLKKHIEKKDAEIADLIGRNAVLENENSDLKNQMKEERAKLDEAADIAAATVKEYRDKILEVESFTKSFCV